MRGPLPSATTLATACPLCTTGAPLLASATWLGCRGQRAGRPRSQGGAVARDGRLGRAMARSGLRHRPERGVNDLDDVSNIENEEDITDGMGDATVNSYWLPALPNAGTELHMQLYGVGSTIEAAGLAVGTGTAGAFVSEQLTHIVYPSTFTNVLTETVMINPGDITGQIVLRMTVDDTANTATGSFSLDGGTTFQSPFSSMPIFAAASSYELLLGAGAVESVTPGPTPTPTPPPTPQLVGSKLILVKNGGDPTTRKAIYIGRQPGGTLTNPIGFGATFRLQIDGNSQCFTLPSALWTAHLHGYTYADRNGTFGPVKTVKVSATGKEPKPARCWDQQQRALPGISKRVR